MVQRWLRRGSVLVVVVVVVLSVVQVWFSCGWQVASLMFHECVFGSALVQRVFS